MLKPPRLVERSAYDDGNVTEIFEVAPGELVTVESWSEADDRLTAEPTSKSGDRDSRVEARRFRGVAVP